MKKQELEGLLEEQSKFVHNLKEKLQNKEKELHELKDSIPSLIEEAKYELWKEQQNTKFLDRYMKEYLKEHLSVEMSDGYSGYVEVKVLVDGEHVCSGDCTVYTGRNGLEE